MKTAIILAATSIAVSASTFAAAYWFIPRQTSTTVWFYYSETRGEMNIGIRPNGTSVIGKNYDRATEAMRLLEMVKAYEAEGRIPDCHEVGYWPLENGERLIPGYPAPERQPMYIKPISFAVGAD